MRDVKIYIINWSEAFVSTGRKTGDDSFPQKGQKTREETCVN